MLAVTKTWVTPYFFVSFVKWPTNAELFHKLSHSYMFRHYHVIPKDPVINTLPSYASISNAAVGNTIYKTPNVNYIWRTAPLTSKVAFYIFIQQI